ncbi:long-chain fatty acid transporter, partial [Pseudomonas syringae pv. pisi]
SSPAAIGNYAAGIAAEAADASIGWYNPAGLSLLHRQELVVGEVTIFPSAKLSGTSTFASQGMPSYFQTFNNLNGAKMGYVPSFHYALPLGQNMTFGLSLVAPFGLATQWDRSGPLRYAATTSNLVTTDLSPEIGGRLNDHFALGLGIDLQYA